jgi:hypothetical protein
MADSPHVETALLSCRTTANIVLCGGPVRQKAVANGALRVLERGSLLECREAAAQCLTALFASSQEPSFLPIMARSTLPLTLCAVAKRYVAVRQSNMYCNAVKTLALLAHDTSSRPFLQTRDIAAELISLANITPPDAAPMIAYALSFLSNGYDKPSELVQLGMMEALKSLHALKLGGSGEGDIAMSGAETLRCISAFSDICAQEVAGPEAVEILALAVKTASACKPQNSVALANASCALYSISSSGPAGRMALGVEALVPVICSLAASKASAEMTIAAICLLLNDTKIRYTFAIEPICMAIAGIIEMNINVR